MRHAPAIPALVAVLFSTALGPSIVEATEPSEAVSTAASDSAADAGVPTEIQKNKTRSNQSNDRAATPAPDASTPPTEAPAEVLKTKTKSNQSND